MIPTFHLHLVTSGFKKSDIVAQQSINLAGGDEKFETSLKALHYSFLANNRHVLWLPSNPSRDVDGHAQST